MKLKFILSIILFLFAFFFVHAQAGTIYFTCETGDRFTLYISGVQQNTIPALQVEAHGVSGTVIPCIITFENPAIPSINGNIGRNDVDVAFVISKDARGSYIIFQKQTPTTLSNGVTVSGTSGSGNTTTVKTNGAYVESVKSGSVEATDHSVKTDKFSVSSNVSVKVKTPAGMPGDLPSIGEMNQAYEAANAARTTTTTTTTTTTSSSASTSQTNPPGTFYFESEGVDSFYLWFNSRKINEAPQMHVEVYDVTDGGVNLRVEFSDRSYKPCSKSMIRWGRDCYYAIQRNNKGEHIIKLKNAVGDLKTPAPQVTQTTTTQAQAGFAPVSTFTIVSAPVATSTTTTVRTTSVNTNTAPAVNTSINVGASQPVISGPLKAELRGNKIMLSDGRAFTVNSFAGTSEAPRIKSTVLQGAKVSITYADGQDAYTATSPFEYTVPKFKSNQSFVFTVDEGGANKIWSVNMPANAWHWINIE